MLFRTLGRTELRVSALSFGAGPISGLMTGDNANLQTAVLKRAIELGINWIDTAPGYGHGKSEVNLGRALGELGASGVHVATKVRLTAEQLADVRGAVRNSVEQSLRSLNRESVTLLQLHNGITRSRGDEPFSLSPSDVFDALEAFREVQSSGLVRFLGLTGTGHPDAMQEVVRSAGFDTIQVPYNLLNPSAGREMPADFDETDYGNIIANCAAMSMGVFAIRVFAGGALLGNEPSPHTFKTPFFPLDLYERDRKRAAGLDSESLKERAVRFVFADARVHSAIVGFGDPAHVEELAAMVGISP